MTDADRGRVPFALVGVLLLVSSMVLATTMQPRKPPAETAVSVTTDRAEAATQTALRDAVHTAADRSARQPVVEPADTAWGAVLNESGTFRDYLRVRIYRQAQRNLAGVESQRDGVRTTASLPAVDNASDLRAAKRRVHVERAGENGTAVRATVENVTLRTERGTRVLQRRNVTITVTVATPVLAMHDRVSAYQAQLNAGMAHPGLTQRLTAQLYPLVWARAYAQYAGAPIDNVVSNRHLAVLTNLALLQIQQSTIGHADPNGLQTFAVAGGKMLANDLMAAAGSNQDEIMKRLTTPTAESPNTVEGFDPPESPRRNDTMTIGVNGTADAVFHEMYRDGTTLETTQSVYSADLRAVTRVETVRDEPPNWPSAPGPEWEVVSEATRKNRSAVNGPYNKPAIPAEYHELEGFGRRVTTTYTNAVVFRKGNRTRIKSAKYHEVEQVSVAIVGRHAPSEYAPRRGIATVHEASASRFEGGNLGEMRSKGPAFMHSRFGDREAMVEAAAGDSLPGETFDYPVKPPRGLNQWLYRDLMTLRERVRNISIELQRGEVGAYEKNPPMLLAQTLADRKSELAEVPDTYETTAQKARVAARLRFIEGVIGRLEASGAQRRSQRGNLGTELSEHGSSTAMLQGSLLARRGSSAGRQAHLSGAAGDVRLRVDSAPSYLTLAELEAKDFATLQKNGHPLVARNVNLFTVPHGDAVDTVLGAAFDPDNGVRLTTAARTLRAANASMNESANATVRAQRDDLQAAVNRSEAHLRRTARKTLASHGVEQPRAVVRDGLSQWDTTANRSIALADRSATAPIMDAVRRRTRLNVTERDRLRLDLNESLRRAADESGARPSRDLMNESRAVLQPVVSEYASQRLQAALNASLQANATSAGLPAGLPIVGNSWYATTNVWVVDVRGEYARFGVWANRGRPTQPGGSLHYQRDGSNVSVDLNGDGSAERLGRASKVSFNVTTAVVVVVPPGKSGVGDRDGVAMEESAGWPTPTAE